YARRAGTAHFPGRHRHSAYGFGGGLPGGGCWGGGWYGGGPYGAYGCCPYGTPYIGGTTIGGGAARSSPRLNRSRIPRYVTYQRSRDTKVIAAPMRPGTR